MLGAPHSDDLPDTVEALRALVTDLRATVRHNALTIDKLKMQLARLLRIAN